jgi:DNA polymerase III sliding clamp (beta) subunit (PCNA family)
MEGVLSLGKLSDFVQCITAISDICNFRISSEGITVTAVDATKAAMVYTRLSASQFESYNPEDIVVGVDIEKIGAILRSLDQNNAVTLGITLQKISIRSGNFSYSALTIDSKTITNEMNIEKIENITNSPLLTARIQMPGSMLNEAINAVSRVADVMDIHVNSEGLIIQSPAKGENETMSLTLKSGEMGVEIPVNGEADTRMSIDLIRSPARAMNRFEKVFIGVGKNHPVAFSSVIGEDGFVTYIVAPRIETD